MIGMIYIEVLAFVGVESIRGGMCRWYDVSLGGIEFWEIVLPCLIVLDACVDGT